MLRSPQTSQHGAGVVDIQGLGDRFPVQHHGAVGRNEISVLAVVGGSRRQRLFARQTPHHVRRSFSRQLILGDVGRGNIELYSQTAEQFPAPRRR